MAENKSYMKSLQAYEKIRDMILSGFKLPGTRLVLSELETELGIGRGPIREALMRLDRSGLVKNIPYKGAVVATPPTRKEILHIYDLRVNLEVKLAVEANVWTESSMGGPGLKEVRWIKPVFTGDTIRVEMEVTAVSPHPKRRDRGRLGMRFTVLNQDGAVCNRGTATGVVLTGEE